MPKQRDPNSVRTRINAALLALGVNASTADVLQHVKAGGIKVTGKQAASFAVQVCQVRNQILKSQKIKVVGGRGRKSDEAREKMTTAFNAKVKGLQRHNMAKKFVKELGIAAAA